MTPAVTAPSLRAMKQRQEKIVALTCYDATMARQLNALGVDVLLVGDSVANVKLGYANTLPVTLEEMLMVTRAVARGNSRALLVADMPFLTYEFDPPLAVKNAGRLVKEGGAAAIKVEGPVSQTIRALISSNIPVMGHLGLTPQSLHRLGGYRVQGRTRSAAARLEREAVALQAAGVFALVLEAVPAPLARRLTRRLKIPTIGIGAGPSCDGQILVLDDLLGLTPGPWPRFVKPYAHLAPAISKAVQDYSDDVRSGKFPGPEQTYPPQSAKKTPRML